MAEDEIAELQWRMKKVPGKSPISLSTTPNVNVSESLPSDCKFKDKLLSPAPVKPTHFEVFPGYEDRYNKIATYELRHMVRRGDEDKVRSLLEEGADPNEFSILSDAVHDRNYDMVKLLLEKGADPNEFDVLSHAVIFCKYDMVKLLLDKGADLNKFDVLSDAVHDRNYDMVKLLLDKGADPNKYTTLNVALSDGNDDIVDILLEKGANPNNVPGYELRYAAMKGHINTVKTLLDKRTNEMMSDALTIAAVKDHIDIVQLLLENGADPTQSKALGPVSANGHIHIVQDLLDKGADPNEFRALSGAAANGHTDIVKMLLDKGADPNKYRALSGAAENGHTDIVKMLLDKGADLNKSSALYRAANNGHTDIVQMLLDKGADPNKTGAMRVAAEQGHKHVIDIFQKWQDKQRIHTIHSPKGLSDSPEVDSDTVLHSAMTSNIAPADKNDANWFMKVVKERNMDDFKKMEKMFAAGYQKDKSCASLLHSVAAYGNDQMVQLMKNWNGLNLDEQYTVTMNRFGDTFDAISVEKATALYIAASLDRTEVAESLVRCAGEDNIRHCFQNIQLSNKMEKVFMLELANQLKRKHHELQPAVVPGHQHSDDDINLRVFIVYSPSVVQASEYDYNGLALVKLRNPYVVTKMAVFESDIKTKVCDTDIDKTKKAIQMHRQVLWNKHSNLNIITESHVKYRRNGSDFENRHCVVLYCSTKGVIPLGEESFPRRLHIAKDDFVDVDIREGFFEHCPYQSLSSTSQHPSLKMGCDIGRLTPQYNAQGFLLPHLGGTLGPFVKHNNKLGFLTCAHVLFDIPSPTYTLDFTASVTNQVEVVQPSTDVIRSHSGICACGVVERAIFDPTRRPSIDAAVVRLTDPARVPSAGQFSNERHSTYENAGFKDLPEYNNGDMLPVADVNKISSTQIIVKFGSKSDVTRGALSVFCTNVRPLSTALGLPSGVGDVEMKDQYQVIGIHPSANFIEKGDSGSGVFCKDLNGVLHCIGMAIGSANVSDYQYRAGVVTPIEAVLQALGPNVTLATFP